jgi:hypothetical protein
MQYQSTTRAINSLTYPSDKNTSSVTPCCAYVGASGLTPSCVFVGFGVFLNCVAFDTVNVFYLQIFHILR